MMKRSNRLRNMGARILPGIGVALVLCLVIAADSVPVLAGVVLFPDPGLEAAIREAIGRPTGDIHDTFLIGLTTLDARYRGIANLEGIEHLVDLTDLDLYGNEIVDITPLGGLANLTTLILSRNQIADIRPLINLTNLKELQLRHNLIREIRPLLDNQALAGDVDIALSFNPLPLQPGSPGLHDIDGLRGRGVTVVFEPIIDLPDPGLEAAIREAVGKPTEDIQNADMLGLTVLDARYHNIINLEGIEHCVNLTELDLYGNQIVEIDALGGLTKLTELTLQDNEIIDISPLSSLTDLTKLALSSNQIVDLGPLASLTSLTALYLWENEILDLSPLSELIELTDLLLYLNDIVDISPLSELTQLMGLGLSWNRIVDISALSSLTNLTRLYLDNNWISDIAPLVDNEGIDQDDIVHLQGNKFLLQAASPNALDIEILEDRGVNVEY